MSNLRAGWRAWFDRLGAGVRGIDSDGSAVGDPGRRRTVLALGIGAPVLAGVGVWYWRHQAQRARADLRTLLEHPFDQIDGGPLILNAFEGAPLLINFWATWCEPCREELPLLAQAQKLNAAKGMQFVGIAIDNPDQVRQFERNSPLPYPNVVAGVGLIDLIKRLGDEPGALPFSLVLDRMVSTPFWTAPWRAKTRLAISRRMRLRLTWYRLQPCSSSLWCQF